MSQPRNQLRINVGFMIHEPIGNYRELDFNFEEIELESDLQLSNLIGKVRNQSDTTRVIVGCQL